MSLRMEVRPQFAFRAARSALSPGTPPREALPRRRWSRAWTIERYPRLFTTNTEWRKAGSHPLVDFVRLQSSLTCASSIQHNSG